MKPTAFLLAMLALTLGLGACVKKQTGARSPEAQEQCESHSEYTWVNNSCIPKASLLNQRATCEERGEKFIWVNGACIEKAELVAPKTRCEEKKDGSTWQVDSQSAKGICVGPTRRVTAREECEAREDSVWDDTNRQCLGPEAQACNRGGDVWIDEQCVTRKIYAEREACIRLNDGSRWVNLRCVSLGEQHCNERGFHFAWHGEPGTCLPKGFADYCGDKDTPADIALTVEAMTDEVGARGDCRTAGEKVASITSLRLGQRRLTSLRPLYGLSELQSLDVQGNEIDDLEPLRGLPKLEQLNLSANKVSVLAPLANLRSLQVLYLSENQISDVKDLAGLANLSKLYLKSNRIANANALANLDANLQGGLDKLVELSLEDNCLIQDVKNLQRFAQLKYLSIKRTGVAKDNIPSFGPSTTVEHSLCP